MMDDDPPTALDLAHAAMAADPDDDASRLGYYGVLADGELFLWLAAEPAEGAFAPHVVDVEGGPVVLAFDREDRLAAAAGAAVPYVALPGRVIAQALAGQGAALGINLGVAASAFLVPPEALSWLAETLDRAPVRDQAQPVAFHPPGTLPPALLATLTARLDRIPGAAAAVLLALADYADGRRGHLLAFVASPPEAEEALARAASEALTFSGLDAGQIDVAFLPADHPALPALARVALALAAPQPDTARNPPPGDRPPRLR